MVAPPLLVSCRPSLQTIDLYNRVVRTLNVDYLAARLFSCQDLVIAYFNLTLFDGRYVPLGFETCWNEVNVHWDQCELFPLVCGYNFQLTASKPLSTRPFCLNHFYLSRSGVLVRALRNCSIRQQSNRNELGRCGAHSKHSRLASNVLVVA
jgi:hypothetical protein